MARIFAIYIYYL